MAITARNRRLLLCAVSFLCSSAALLRPLQALEPSGDYAAIQRAFLREDFAEVASLARPFITQSPQAPEAPRVWLWFVLSLDRLRQSQEAMEELDRLQQQLPANDALWAETLYWEGDISRRAFQMARAIEAYQQVLDRYPGSTWTAQARLGLGLIALYQQRFEDAIAQFRQIASERADTVVGHDALLYQGLALLRLQRFQEAIAMLEPLVAQLEDQGALAQAALYLGESYNELERYEEALGAYERAIRAGGTTRWAQLAHFGVGWTAYQLGQCERSLSAFDAYLRHTTADHWAEALFAQGGCLLRLGREREALTRFEQVYSRDANHPLAIESGLVLVDAYQRQERFALAKELLHTMLRRYADPAARAKVQLRLGTIALAQGNVAQARTVYQLARDTDDVAVQQGALTGLGDVQMFMGQVSQALQLYTQAIELAPETSLAQYARYQSGRAHLQGGDAKEAIQVFSALRESSDPVVAADAQLALVIAYVNQGDDASARAVLERIRAVRPATVTTARAAYYGALLALGADDEQAAVQLCREAIAGAPGSEEAFEARLLLLDLDTRDLLPVVLRHRLTDWYRSARLPVHQRAKLAKRIADLARADHAYSDALQWYDRAAQLLPSLANESSYRMASCYEEAGDVELAMRWYGQIAQPPWRIRGQLALAKLLERQERFEDAEAIYERLAAEPIPEAQAIRERLMALRDSVTNKEWR